MDVGNESFQPAVSLFTSRHETKRKTQPISRWLGEIAETDGSDRRGGYDGPTLEQYPWLQWDLLLKLSHGIAAV